LVQERIVTSRSKLSDQHQGHDAILEEINKTLKSLVPLTVATALRVRIRNCTYKGIDFIKAKLTKETLLGIWQPISTIREEANSQKTESSLTKSQILSIINFLSDSQRLRFRGLSSKSRNGLANILQEIGNVLFENSISIINNIEEILIFHIQ